MNFSRLSALFGPVEDLDQGVSYRLKAGGYMDLVVERLPDCEDTGFPVVSMAHYYKSNGDLCQDPEMTVRIMPQGFAEALTFQQANPPAYQVVYPEPGHFYPKLKTSLNKFLGTWLRNLKSQGHAL